MERWLEKWNRKILITEKNAMGKRRMNSIWDELHNLKNRSDIFIHFSDLEQKLGINPRSKFNTPNGVYSYPLKEIWDLLENNKIPFAGDREFIHIIKTKPDIKLVDTSDHVPEKVLEKMAQSWADKFPKKEQEFEFETNKKYIGLWRKALSNPEVTRADDLYVVLFFIVEDFQKNSQAVDENDLQALESMRDDFFYWAKAPGNIKKYLDTMLEENPNFSKQLEKTSEIIEKYMTKRKWVHSKQDPTEVLKLAIDYASENAYVQAADNFGIFWAMGYMIKNPNKWSHWLVKDLKIDGVTDRKGTSVIHPGEPIQAVFFNPSKWELYKTVENPWKHRDTVGTTEEYSRQWIEDRLENWSGNPTPVQDTIYSEGYRFFEHLLNLSTNEQAHYFQLLAEEMITKKLHRPARSLGEILGVLTNYKKVYPIFVPFVVAAIKKQSLEFLYYLNNLQNSLDTIEREDNMAVIYRFFSQPEIFSLLETLYESTILDREELQLAKKFIHNILDRFRI